MPDEEFEHIPWSNLAAREDDRRSRLLYIGVAVAAALVIGIVAARWFVGPRHGGDTSDPVASADTTATPIETLPPPAVTTTSLLSEADLLAATDQLIDHYRIDDDTWARLAEHLDERQLVEAMFVVGTYTCLAMAFNSFGLQIDPELDTSTTIPFPASEE